MSSFDKLREHLALVADNQNALIEASEEKRWFRFRNSKNVLFDRKTNLLWLNHPDFPYGKTVKKGKGVEEKNKAPYSIDDGYAEARNMLEEKNDHWIGNCIDWTIPTVDEFRQLLEDESCPLFEKETRTIKGQSKWCTRSGCIDLERGVDDVSYEDAFIIPCSHAYVPRASKSTLDIFIDNLLDPIFKKGAISKLYRQLYSPAFWPTIRQPWAPPIDGFEMSDLLKYIAELEDRLARESDRRPSFTKLKNHLATIDDNKNKIIEAIEKQRWFQLKNTSTVIFDRDTNLLWFDITCLSHHPFPYGKDKNKIPYSIDDGYAEVKDMLIVKNKNRLGNCMDWDIPTVNEFRQLIEDKTFPLLDLYDRTIKGQSRWCTQSGCIDLERGIDVVSNEDAFILPCSHAYVRRAPKSTLDIFIDNLIDPIFNDDAINELYRRLYSPAAYPTIRRPTEPAIEGFEKTDLLKYIAELEDRIAQFKALAEAAQRIAK